MKIPSSLLDRATRLALLPTVVAMLMACGGGDDQPLVAVPARGSVVSAAVKIQLSAAQIDAATAKAGSQALTGVAACGVEVRHVVYNTRDPKGTATTASTAVMVPTGSAAACTNARPVLLYAHGTSIFKTFDMSDVTSATELEAGLVMTMYAAQGFIVVAPNYQGYTDSALTYHPYIVAEHEASDMIDGLRAAKAHLTGLAGVAEAARPGAQLLVSGYSQGGHVAMATHKVIERDYASELTVTASGPMSGPYNLAGFGDAVFASPNVGALRFIPMLMSSYQQVYGDVYAKVTDAYQTPYAATIEGLFPGTETVEALMAAGKLPNDPTQRALFGTGGLLTDSFRAAFPTSNLRKNLQTNTLLGWTPKRPMALCGGANDPTVFWAVNGPVAQADFAARGATVPAFDLEAGSTVATTDPTYPVYAGFAQAKANTAAQAVAAGATDGGVSAVLGAYHGSLVPPFCTALVRGYFQQVLASGS